ncbi:SNARE-associated protein Snapin [Parasteatoda tepidariorum]|uniref:SNARE-associated protein Snapin n=1 Tax=Parasteatoda tepidariorum TaxID=114398 RepID=UPI00077FA6B4|nr:SNARE-associated protein Snapin [Parasteatoda tepidariorum]XP_042899199.1 SNARE-associated protein Snapin [Parasteatoda tepidariorum]
MEDTASTTTSIDDKTDDCADSPTRDALAEGLMELLRPSVEQLDDHVRLTLLSQKDLRHQIESLSDELRQISETYSSMFDLDVYVKKLMNAKRRVMLVNNILQNAQERLNRLHQSIARETQRRKALLENNPTAIQPSA